MFDPNIKLTSLTELGALLHYLEPDPPICGMFDPNNPFKFTGETKYEIDGTCNHCGSLSQSQFFMDIVAGCELGTTDKSYKVYVHSPRKRNKFYFQHLTEMGMSLFVLACNARLLKYEGNHGFYVLPYFMRIKQ